MIAVGFVPFAGLAVAPKRPWATRRQETVIALMGPAWGLVLAAALLLGHWLTGSLLLAGLGALTAAINLFNLISPGNIKCETPK